MVGIVIVSHSKMVAEGTVELAGQMAKENRLVACGGMEDGTIGTDAVRIMAAIEAANDGDGVAILADLGSGILSAQTAIDLLESPIEVRIADAPIVEGAISAAMQASFGASLDEVIDAAEIAREMSKID